jgi:hypothetical protein
MVHGECFWKLGGHIDGKDGDIAWRMLRSWVVTPQLLHQWNKRVTVHCQWCSGNTGSLKHMFLTADGTILWNRLTGILNQILGTHDLTKKLILYDYRRLDTTETN